MLNRLKTDGETTMQLQKILLILDKPNRPQTALKRTRRILRDSKTPVQVEVVSFLNDHLIAHAGVFEAKKRKELKKALLTQHKEWLADLYKADALLPAPRVVWSHNLVDWVRDNAHEFDLVVKTAGGSKRARSATDWALLNACPTHLLLVGHRRVRQPQSVLVGLDMEKSDGVHKALNRKVIDAACTLAALSKARVHAACVVEVNPALIDLDLVSEKQAARRLKAASEDRLNKLLKADVSIKRHFPVGPIGQAMADCAKAVSADVVVVGAREQNLKSALGLGSAAQRIVRKAPCDVLAVRG